MNRILPGEIERSIINHCSPVIMGCKPASLFPLSSPSCLHCLSSMLPAAKRKLSGGKRRIGFMVLRGASESGQENGKRILVMVYDCLLLRRVLSDAAAQSLLAALGYPIECAESTQAEPAVYRCLSHLKKKAGGKRDAAGIPPRPEPFPHEVGIFLGYPPEDVRGFVEQGGQNYKLCGYWKVYGDVEKAKKRFSQYTRCREEASFRLKNKKALTIFR